MVKCLLAVIVLVSVFFAGSVRADDQKAQCATVSTRSDDQPGIFGFNPFKAWQARGLGDDEGGGIDRMGVMSSGQSYDGNTGMPNVVASDSSDQVW